MSNNNVAVLIMSVFFVNRSHAKDQILFIAFNGFFAFNVDLFSLGIIKEV